LAEERGREGAHEHCNILLQYHIHE